MTAALRTDGFKAHGSKEKECGKGWVGTKKYKGSTGPGCRRSTSSKAAKARRAAGVEQPVALKKKQKERAGELAARIRAKKAPAMAKGKARRSANEARAAEQKARIVRRIESRKKKPLTVPADVLVSKGSQVLPEKKKMFTGTEAQQSYAADLMSKLESQSDFWIKKRKASIEKRSKSEAAKRTSMEELWEEVRDLRIVKSISSAGVAIEYLKNQPLDRELSPNPSMAIKNRMNYDKSIPESLKAFGWTANDKEFQSMVRVYGLEDFAPAYAK